VIWLFFGKGNLTLTEFYPFTEIVFGFHFELALIIDESEIRGIWVMSFAPLQIINRFLPYIVICTPVNIVLLDNDQLIFLNEDLGNVNTAF